MNEMFCKKGLTSGNPKNIPIVASVHVPKKRKAAWMFHLASMSGTE